MTHPSAFEADPGPDARTRRTLVLAAGLAGVLVCGVGSVFLLGGGAEVTAAPAPLVATAAGAVPSPVPDAVAGAAAGPVTVDAPQVLEANAPPAGARTGRDPFRALQVTAVAPAAPPAPPELPPAPDLPAPAVVAPAPDAGRPLVGTVQPAPQDGGGQTPPAPPTGTGSSAAFRSVTLRSVQESEAGLVATLVVDGTTATARAGDRVGSLTLLSLHQGPTGGRWTAVLRNGTDEPFDLVDGATVRR